MQKYICTDPPASFPRHVRYFLANVVLLEKSKLVGNVISFDVIIRTNRNKESHIH